MKTLLTTVALAALLAGAPALAEDYKAPATTDAPAATEPAQSPDAMKKKPLPDAAAETPDAAAKAPDAAAAPDANAPAPDAAAQAPADATTPAPAPDATAKAPADATTPAAKPADTAAATSPSYIDQQKDDELLASNWIGQTIYNQADENLGDINDLVLAKDGKIDAIVIGVGGFLGIGEKNVAVPFSAIQASQDANGSMKLMIQASKDDLDKAPEFMSLAQINAQKAMPVEPAPSQ